MSFFADVSKTRIFSVRSVPRGEIRRWRPLRKVQKHRPCQQARGILLTLPENLVLRNEFFYSTRQTLFEIGYRIYVIYEHTGNWENCGGVSIYNSLEAVKKALFYEYDFSCEETAESDKFGDKIYKEN